MKNQVSNPTRMTRRRNKQRGAALVTAFLVLMILAMAGATYVSAGLQRITLANRQQYDVQTSHLAEAGMQDELGYLWQDFQTNQNFNDLDRWCAGASATSPASTFAGSISPIGNYSVGVVSYSVVDNFTRTLTLQAVGWVDGAGTGLLTAQDPQQVIQLTATYQLNRSDVFDYTYFVNNYGWMDGFQPSWLVVNGDMRANGNFSFTNGDPTVNGSAIACANSKLVPAAVGTVNAPPVKWSTSTYASSAATQPRWRQGYNSGVEGSVGSTTFMNNIGIMFDSTGMIVNSQIAGAVMADANGIRSWDLEAEGGNPTITALDPTPTSELVMPDLYNMSTYTALSQNWSDPTPTFSDGTTNPYYNQGAWIQVWNTTSNKYTTVTTNGNVSGTTTLIGTSAHPIKIHGPVTVSQDAIISGYVSGQGTIYAGRNVQIVGSVIYSNPPNFTNVNGTQVDSANGSKDMLGLAASGSIIMGDTSGFSNPYPLYYMEPPFTQGRYDAYGNYIPPFNATSMDSTGHMLYQSVMGDSYIHSISSPVNEIDAIMYTNNVAGGNIATGGSGITLNGSIISKDEAMVVWSLPMNENYDERIRDQGPSSNPLIDIDLPRSPVVLQTSWKSLGFSMSY
jgi:hypothetical protein